ncbi:MAG: hypothetical protein GXP31_07440 [Kiritimatiellaeota bacterium]|nr:hypothetical protein [Kiritimatiellota bacterium]
MFRPVEMIKVHVLVLEKYLDAVTRALGESGFVHLVDAAAESREGLLGGVDREKDIRELERLCRICDALIDSLSVRRRPFKTETPPEPLAQARTFIEQVQADFEAEDDAINDLINESGALVQQAARLELYPFRRIRLEALKDLHHLYMATGRLAPRALSEAALALEDRALLLHDYDESIKQERVLVLSSRRSRWAVESALKKAGFEPEELPVEFDASPDEEKERVQGRLNEIRRAVEEHRRHVLQLGQRHGKRLTALYTQLSEALSMARAQQQFGKAARIYCISGWAPRDAEADARRRVAGASDGTGIVEVLTPKEDERVRRGEVQVPVKFPSIRALRPFQKLVTAYGPPRYEEVEPSLFLALSFVLMFGMMFGDVGQGLVVLALGAYFLRSTRPAIRRLRDVGYLLLFCGGSAVVFGVLYDSFFGREEIISRIPGLDRFVLVHPLQNVMILFKTAVVVGVVLISAGVLINIVNKFRAGHYFEGVFDKFGVIGIVFYWGSLGLGLKAAMANRIHGYEVWLFIVLPLALLFLHKPLEGIVRHRKRLIEEDWLGFLLGSSIEVMETLTTFLGNTVSFVRLAGFALAHAALCMAVYSLADMLRGVPGSGLWGGLIILAGNVFVILLEGMVVAIQGIRLEYYEFFSKFFSGDGVLYAPFRLRTASGPQTDSGIPEETQG